MALQGDFWTANTANTMDGHNGVTAAGRSVKICVLQAGQQWLCCSSLRESTNRCVPIYLKCSVSLFNQIGWHSFLTYERKDGSLNVRRILQGWRDGSAGLSTCCPCGRPAFDSQHPCGGPQSFLSVVPEDLNPSDLHKHQAYTWCTHRQNKMNKLFKKIEIK